MDSSKTSQGIGGGRGYLLGYNGAMARELTPAALFFKWFAVPLAVAAFGYFVAGPRYGGPVQNELQQSQTKSVDENAEAKANGSNDSKENPKVNKRTGPEIEVTAKPVSRRTSSHRQETKKPKKAPVAVDPGSDAIPVQPVQPVPPEKDDSSPGTSGNDDGG